MTRYYIDAEDGPVSRPEGRVGQARVWAYPDDHKGPLQPEYTEVRIVPADAIVIERAELPEVRDHNGGITTDPEYSKGATTYYGDALHSRREALRYLAMAEYIAAHPPVGAAALEALSVVIAKSAPGWSMATCDIVAHALIRAGYAKGGE